MRKHAGLFACALDACAVVRPAPAPVPAQEALVSTSRGRKAEKHCTWRSWKTRRSEDEVHRGGMADDEESNGVHVLNAPCLSRNSAIWCTLHTFFYLVDLPFLSLLGLGLGKFPFYSLDLSTSLDCPLRTLTVFCNVHDSCWRARYGLCHHMDIETDPCCARWPRYGLYICAIMRI
jgi:hypothetical protein